MRLAQRACMPDESRSVETSAYKPTHSFALFPSFSRRRLHRLEQWLQQACSSVAHSCFASVGGARETLEKKERGEREIDGCPTCSALYRSNFKDVHVWGGGPVIGFCKYVGRGVVAVVVGGGRGDFPVLRRSLARRRRRRRCCGLDGRRGGGGYARHMLPPQLLVSFSFPFRPTDRPTERAT